MDFRQLRYFIQVHREGSFLKAASSLGLTQPALSQQISLLEREIGQEIFERTSRGILLTRSGETLLAGAVSILDLWKETVENLKQPDQEPEGEYSISAGGTVAAFILPRVLRDIRREYPGLSFRVVEGDARETLEALQRGDADLGILTGPIREREITSSYYLTDRIVPVVAAVHRLARRRKKVTADDLRQEDFVFFHPASAIRRVMEKRFRSIKPPFRIRIAMELRSMESILRSLEANLGAGFISEFAIGSSLHRLPIPELMAERKFYICHRRQRPGLDHLIKAIRKFTGAYLNTAAGG